MRRRKPKPTLLPTPGIFNLPPTKLYTAGKWIATQLDIMAVTRIHTPVPRVTYITP